MPKAVAIQAVFMVGAIAIFFFFVIGIFFQWGETSKLGTSQASCFVKRLNYCSGLTTGKEPYEWSSKEPLDCSKFFTTPTNKNDCCQQIPTLPKCQ